VEGFLVDSMASGRERPRRGKHRTEVTEVTEGDWRFDGATLLVDSMASGRERSAPGKASHRGHGNHRKEELMLITSSFNVV
jgi:hypothetical protein